MRLIDADRFAEISKHHIPEVLEDTFDEGYIACLKAVDLTPTVKAIPINWIKNYASHKASKDLIDCYWHFWEDDVLKMVEDWEKENEK